MKHKTFISLIGLLLLASISFIGCNDNGGGGSSQTLTENDFVDNPSLRVDPDNQIIVDFLESPDSDTPQYDTGPMGIDDIPLTYPYTETVTFCWTDNKNSGDMDYMVLLDSQGEQVLRVDVNGDCVTDTIEPGNYVMELHHDDSTEPHTIFMGPNLDANEQAMKTDGLHNGFEVQIAKRLKGSEKRQRPRTGIRPTPRFVLQTNLCRGCYLENANFSRQHLKSVYLKFSNARYANFNMTVLEDCVLNAVNFGGADLRRTNFLGSDLVYAHIDGDICRQYAFYEIPFFWSTLWCNATCRCITTPYPICGCYCGDTDAGSIASQCYNRHLSCENYPSTSPRHCIHP